MNHPHTGHSLTCPTNLRQGRSAATSDLNAHATRLLALGFNAVRLPFSFARLLDAAAPTPVVSTCTAASPVQLQVRSLSLKDTQGLQSSRVY